MTSFALVFNSDGDFSLNTRIDPTIRELCSYWVILSPDNDVTGDLCNSMEGIGGQVIELATIPADERVNKLDEALLGRATHLIFLHPGFSTECDLGFHINTDNKPEQVLCLSPSRDVGYWKTIIVPNSKEYWELDDSCNVVVKHRQNVHRNHGIRIIDQNRFPRKRSLDATAIEDLINKYRTSLDSESALHIAEAFAKWKEYEKAIDWCHVVLERKADTNTYWRAHMHAAQFLMRVNYRWNDIEAHLASAFDLKPDRMESLYYLVKHYWEAGDYLKAYELAELADEIEEPAEHIEFELDIYRYLFAAEFAKCSQKLGYDSKCMEIINATLRKAPIPEETRRELANIRANSYEHICPVYPVNIHRQNCLLIVIAFRNAGELLKKCITSIQQQTYHEYRVILMDDSSTDGALASIGMLEDHFTVIVNDKRMGALYNQVGAIRENASEDDIVVHLDGDDWLASKNVLTKINDFFNRTRCWLMYGQYESSLGTYGSCEPIVPNGESLQSQLSKMLFPMHIRAYRAGVLFDLLRQDPDLHVLKDENGAFLDAISDLALMRALIQVAGIDNTRYNEEILYIYNRSNPESHYQTRESISLQRHQSESTASKPLLDQAKSYYRNEAANHYLSNTSTLFIALDGATPSLIEKWARDSQLPNLARMLDKCNAKQIRVPAGFGNDAFWTGLFTGCLPDETGYFFRMIWNPETYEIEYRDPAEQVKQDSFWTRLANTDSELAIIDMPEIKNGKLINGLEISEWLPHARSSKLETCPEGLRMDVLERFGDDPLGGSTERSTPRSEQETEHDLNLLLDSIEQKTRAALHYLERGGWDYFAVGYQQAHDAGHQFWHLHDTEHSRFSKSWHEVHGDPLLKVYQSIDSGLGKLVDRAGDDINLIIVAGLSMQSKNSGNPILDRILWEIDVYDRRQAGENFPELQQYDERRFNSLPHNNLSGAIRINLADRESRGVVAEGQEYEDTIELLKYRLSQLTHSDTGGPVISQFIPVREVYSGGRIDELADLFVVWNRDKQIREISSPYFDPIKVRINDVIDTRSGDHTGHATLYSNLELMTGNTCEVKVEDIAARLMNLISASKNYTHGQSTLY